MVERSLQKSKNIHAKTQRFRKEKPNADEPQPNGRSQTGLNRE
jgi:hypothetical protein